MIIKFQSDQQPVVDIFINNILYKKNLCVQQQDQLQIDNKKFYIKIVLKNKSERDTVVKDGKIVQDKFIKISGLVFDQLHLEESEFLNMYNPTINHNIESFKGNYLGFNDPSYLECLIQHPRMVLLKNIINAGSPIDYEKI